MSLFVAVGNRYCGSKSIEDQLCASVASAVEELEAMHIHVILLTGDSQAAAEMVASQMGIFRFHSGLLLEQNSVEVAAHAKRGHTVAMVGDGINDAQALSEPTVGVAIGSGTDVARESADVALLGNDLEKVC
jgi:Cd2+/Zn2+-exporting ATPase/Cu+-exporting ATPase